MASVVESRMCPKCKTQYRTKLKKAKGSTKDARPCPSCGRDNSKEGITDAPIAAAE